MPGRAILGVADLRILYAPFIRRLRRLLSNELETRKKRESNEEVVMLIVQEVSPEQLAKLIHDHQQDFVASDRWDELPSIRREVMTTAARLILLHLNSAPAEDPYSRRSDSGKEGRECGC